MVDHHNRQHEIEELQEELNYFKQEREKVRALIGQVGGSNESRKDKILNYTFIGLIAGLFLSDIIGHFYPEHKLLDFQISLELGVFMVSLKIIWMMHRQAKVEHFQFWILNSIEYRLTELSKRTAEIEDKIDDISENQSNLP